MTQRWWMLGVTAFLALMTITVARAGVQCPPGTFIDQDASGTFCSTCLAGSFTDAVNEPACRLCSTGFIAPDDGATECTECSAGTYAPARGGDACLTCGLDEVSSPGASACTACAPGFVPDGSGGFCVPCPAGTFDDPSGGGGQCSPCGPGEFSAEGAVACLPCAPGTVTGPGATSCVTCPAGRQPTPDQSLCEPCEAGSFSTEGAASCLPCAAGSSSPPEAAFCTPCDAGDFQTDGPSGLPVCEQCELGTFSASAGQTTCLGCPAGTVAANDQTSCVECGPGTAPDPQDIFCTLCEPGTFSPGGTDACLLCPDGFSSTVFSSSCFPCFPGTFGTTNGLGLPTCEDRPPGTFSAAQASAECVLCPVGTEPNVFADACDLCGIGTFNDGTTGGVCEVCPEGFTNDLEGSASCDIPLCDAQLYDCDPLEPSLTVSALIPGQLASFEVQGLPAGSQVAIGGSFDGPGVGPCHPSGLACLFLDDAFLLGFGPADANGNFLIERTVPPAFAGVLFVQGLVVDGDRGAESEVLLRIANDSDNDFWLDSVDNCPDVANPTQADVDDDGDGEACDCNDFSADFGPSAIDTLGDGVDQDCDGIDG